MGKNGNSPKSGGVTEENVESGIDMGFINQYGLVTLSAMTLFIGIAVAEITSSGSVRKVVLKMDEASLSVWNEVRSDLILSVLSDQCYRCWPQPLGLVPAAPGSGNVTPAEFTVDTQHPLTLQLNATPSNVELCRAHVHFGERGRYSLRVTNPNCTVATLSEPVNSYLPILFAFLVLAGLFAAAAVWRTVMGSACTRNLFLRFGTSLEAERLINSDLGSPSSTTASADFVLPASSSRRLRSVDTFRGLALLVMIFVNYGGGRYWFFRHQSWNGLTVADLVFPWFVFIMGTSISLSVSGALSRGVTRSSLMMKICWRSFQLFLIGLLVINPNYCAGPLSWDSLHIPGVLQRLAVTYLLVATLDVFFCPAPSTAHDRWSLVRDVALCWPAWACVLALEVVWLCVTFLLPVPGCPTGYLGPGGIGDFGQFPDCTGGAAAYVDRLLLGEKHMYQTPSSRVTYRTTAAFDPEGVLGSVNSVATAFLGLQAGRILLRDGDRPKAVLTRFLICGFLLGIVSAVLTRCSTDRGFVPVNKNLWSLSYATVSGCFAFALLSACYYAVDAKRWWSGAPFFYPGTNSILVYVGHEVFANYFPFRWSLWDGQSHAEHLLQNLLAVSIWAAASYALYRKRIFWKI